MTRGDRRARQFLSEARASAGLGGAVLGALVGASARVAGSDLGWAALVAGAVAVAYVIFARAVQTIRREVRSAEDAVVLAARLGSAAPLFGRWAVEGDFAGIVARELESCPDLVVECGSGSTTLVIASQLKQNGYGRLVSLEHDAHYAESISRRLDAAGLADVADVIVAPLKDQRFDGRRVAWYEAGPVQRAIDGRVDLLVVDGPPQTSPWARWPAVQFLHRRFAQAACVLVDDGRTAHSRRTASAWTGAFADLELYWIDTVKGTWLLRRSTRQQGRLFGSLLSVVRTLNPRPTGFGRWPVRR
jgi:hypothetical protein